MTFNRYQYFRWTRRTALISFNYIILAPAILGVAAWATEVRSERPASNLAPRALWKRKADLIGDDCRANGTSGRSERETCLLSIRPVVTLGNGGGFVHQTGRDTARNTKISFVKRRCDLCWRIATPRPAHQNSMPNKTNRDIMMRQHHTGQNTPHRIALGQLIGPL